MEIEEAVIVYRPPEKHLVINAPVFGIGQDVHQATAGPIVQNQAHSSIGVVVTEEHGLAPKPGVGQEGFRKQELSCARRDVGFRYDFHAAISHF